jgi:hypothetical protein
MEAEKYDVLFEAMVEQLELKSCTRPEIISKINDIMRTVEPSNYGRRVIMRAFIYYMIRQCSHVDIGQDLVNLLSHWHRPVEDPYK